MYYKYYLLFYYLSRCSNRNKNLNQYILFEWRNKKTCTLINKFIIHKINKIIKIIIFVSLQYLFQIVMIYLIIVFYNIYYVCKLHIYYKKTFELNNQIGSSHICV